MVASVQKNTTEFLRVSAFFLSFWSLPEVFGMCYLHSSWQKSPFHNRCPRSVQKSDTHHKHIPASLILGLTLAFHAKLPARLFLLGMYWLTAGKCQATPRRAWQQAMHIPVPGCIFSFRAGAAQAVAQLENGLYSSSSKNQKMGREIHLPHPTVLLLSTAASA